MTEISLPRLSGSRWIVRLLEMKMMQETELAMKISQKISRWSVASEPNSYCKRACTKNCLYNE